MLALIEPLHYHLSPSQGGGGSSEKHYPANNVNTKLTLHTYTHICTYVTGFGKTLRMRFFPKIEFDVRLISPTIELTRVQVLDRSRASLWSYRALFAIAPHPQQLRNYGLKALLCTRMAFPYTTRIPEVN